MFANDFGSQMAKRRPKTVSVDVCRYGLFWSTMCQGAEGRVLGLGLQQLFQN